MTCDSKEYLQNKLKNRVCMERTSDILDDDESYFLINSTKKSPKLLKKPTRMKNSTVQAAKRKLPYFEIM